MSGAPSATAGSLAGLKVLVVEDVRDNQILMQLMLGKQGAEVSVANDGIEGVRMALNQPFHVVLMDIQMPRMGGYEAMQILQAERYQAPVIALTAHASQAEQTKTLQAGFRGHLTKPLDRQKLLDVLLKCAVV